MYRDYFCYSFNFLPLAAASSPNLTPAASVFTPLNVRFAPDADFEILRVAYTATDPRVYFKLREDATGRYFTDAPAVDGRIFAGGLVTLGSGGNALLFKNFARSINIPGGTIVTLEAADFSGGSNTVRVTFHGVKKRNGNNIPTQLGRKYNASLEYYFAVPITAVLGASAAAQFAIVGDNSADFWIQRVSCTRTNPSLITINTGGMDMDWMDSPVHIDNFTGNIAGYNILPEPKILPATTVLTVNLTDLGSGSTTNLLFEGSKKVFGR
jgi:hypothetical protein